MFKKTLLALALTGLAGVANAAVVESTEKVDGKPVGDVISIEGAAGADSVTASALAVTLKAEYAVGDTVTFTLSGAKFAKGAAPKLKEANDKIVFGLLSVDGSVATYRVTSLPETTTSTVDVELKLSVIDLDTDSVVGSAGKVTVSYAAATSTGLAIDAGTKAAVVATKANQFATKVETPLNAVIDVENGRKQFAKSSTETGDAEITTDVLVIAPDFTEVTVEGAKYTGATYVINGNFSWMDVDGKDGVTATELAAAFKAEVGDSDKIEFEINEDANAITITVADESAGVAGVAGVAGTVTATFTVLGADDEDAPVLSDQTFTIDSTVNYTTAASNKAASKVTQSAAAAGAWTLNGFVEDITFMPFTNEYFQSITVANTGDVESTITVDITANGETETHELVAKAAAKAITNISKEVKAFAVADGVDGNAHVKVVVNSPAKDISVSGVYYHKADKDRVKTK